MKEELAVCFEDAYTDYLQNEWDNWLIDGWQKYNSINMQKSKNYFCYKYNINDDRFVKLKRIPKFTRHYRCCLTRYIAAYLPKINTMLWNGTASKETILKVMKKIDTSPIPSDASKVSKENYERTIAKKEAMAESVSHQLVKEQRESNGRNNWKVCK